MMRSSLLLAILALSACPRFETEDPSSLFRCADGGVCDPGYTCVLVDDGRLSEATPLCVPEDCLGLPGTCTPDAALAPDGGSAPDVGGAADAGGRDAGAGVCGDSGRPLPKIEITEFVPPRAHCPRISVKYVVSNFDGISECDGGRVCGRVHLDLTSGPNGAAGHDYRCTPDAAGFPPGNSLLGYAETREGTISADLGYCAPALPNGVWHFGVYVKERTDAGFAFMTDCETSGLISDFDSFEYPGPAGPEPIDASLVLAPTPTDHRFSVSYGFANFGGNRNCSPDAGRSCGRAVLYLKGPGWIDACSPLDGGFAGVQPSGQPNYLAFSDDPTGVISASLDQCPGLVPTSEGVDYTAVVHLMKTGAGSHDGELYDVCDGEGFVGASVPITVPDPPTP